MPDFASEQDWMLALQSALGCQADLINLIDEVRNSQSGDVMSASIFRSTERRVSPHLAHDLLWRFRALKKFNVDVIPQELAARAIEGFKERNASVGDRTVIRPAIRAIMRRLLDEWLPVFPDDEFPSLLPRLGPGAVAEHFSYLRKRELLIRGADVYWTLMSQQCEDSMLDHHTARLCAVPKTVDKARLITVEPYLHTLVQQAARSYITRSMMFGSLMRYRAYRRFWDVMPSHQRYRALASSADGRDATIDLSNASDCIPYDLVADIFPGHIMAWIDISRSTLFKDDEGVYPLNIFGGMGNATTFIVETLTFAAYVISIAQYYSLPARCTVFGDDIICSSELYDSGLLEKESSFFKVNKSKSFSGCNPMRESCGIFAYSGEDITCPCIRGYNTTLPQGKLALAELCQGLIDSRFLSQNLLASWIVSSRVLPNLRFLPRNYPGVRCWWEPWTEQQIRINRNTQQRETFLPIAREKVRLLPADKHWMLPAASIDAITTVNRKVGGRNRSFVTIPTGKYRVTGSWLPVS
nr:MAG: hypothetical protein 3 [Leviviridae sp.]